MNKFVSKRGEIWKDIPKKTFRSMKQAAKEIGGTGAGIKYSIKNNKPYKKRYLFYEIYIR